jgi:hypothetical protein
VESAAERFVAAAAGFLKAPRLFALLLLFELTQRRATIVCCCSWICEKRCAATVCSTTANARM